MKIKEKLWITFCLTICWLIAPFYLVGCLIQKLIDWANKRWSIYYWID